MILKDKRVLVVGLAKSGLAAAKLLTKKGTAVTITDDKPKRFLTTVLKDVPRGVRVEVGSRKIFSQPFDLIVTSPGVPWNHPDLVKARKRGVPVWPEIELAWRFIHPKKTVAITGTNGKTTTTALIGHILKKAGFSVVVGGNIGTPLSTLVDKIHPSTYLVLEVSSYQMEAHQTFHPNVGVFLNLTPDHLARHGTMSGYANAKARLFKNFSSADIAVLNSRDVWCGRVGKKINSKKIWFPNKIDRALAANLSLPGEHNQENAMAAAGALRALGLTQRQIAQGMKTFKGVAHRIELVRIRREVRYINDSKATNVDSTMVALKSFPSDIILIMGGEHKGSPYTPLRPLIKKRVKRILTIGEAAPLIEKDLRASAPITPCGTLRRAVLYADAIARAGDVVLLSPACASFDQFRNFEHRGETFAALVRRLKP